MTVTTNTGFLWRKKVFCLFWWNFDQHTFIISFCQNNVTTNPDCLCFLSQMFFFLNRSKKNNSFLRIEGFDENLFKNYVSRLSKRSPFHFSKLAVCWGIFHIKKENIVHEGPSSTIFSCLCGMVSTLTGIVGQPYLLWRPKLPQS